MNSEKYWSYKQNVSFDLTPVSASSYMLYSNGSSTGVNRKPFADEKPKKDHKN